MKSKEVKNRLVGTPYSTIKDMLLLAKRLNSECGRYVNDKINKKLGFEPYILIRKTDKGELFGVVVTKNVRLVDIADNRISCEYTFPHAVTAKKVVFNWYVGYTLGKDGSLQEVCHMGYRKHTSKYAYIDCVKTSKMYRHRSIATAMIRDVMEPDMVAEGFKGWKLDSVMYDYDMQGRNVRSNAIGLYSKLGAKFDPESVTVSMDNIRNLSWIRTTPMIKNFKGQKYNKTKVCPLSYFRVKQDKEVVPFFEQNM